MLLLPNTEFSYLDAPDGRIYKVQVRGRGVLDVLVTAGTGPLIVLSWLLHWMVYPRKWVVEVKLHGPKHMSLRPTVYTTKVYSSRRAARQKMEQVEVQVVRGEWTPDEAWLSRRPRRKAARSGADA